jgi:hypothetical protein
MKPIAKGIWILGIALIWMSNGCMSVDELAIRANAKELAPGGIKGFIVDPANPHIPKAIVISYSPIGTPAVADDPVLLVPTDSAGRPLVKRQDAIPMPTGADFDKANAAYHSRYFTEEDPRHPGVRWETTQYDAGPVSFRIIAEPFVANKRANIGEPDLILYVQFKVPRPQRDIDADRFRAAVLTPPTAVCEFCFMPLGALVWYLAVVSSQ